MTVRPIPVRHVAITQVRLDEDGRLLVVPDLRPEEPFDLIYRAGMEISWKPTERALASPLPGPGGWSCSDWFRRMRHAAAEEYAANLAIDDDTMWSVPEHVRKQIESAV